MVDALRRHTLNPTRNEEKYMRTKEAKLCISHFTFFGILVSFDESVG